MGARAFIDSAGMQIIIKACLSIIIFFTLKFLFEKALKDFKKEGWKGVWQEGLTGLIVLILFIIALFMKPTSYIAPLWNILSTLINVVIRLVNDTIIPAIGLHGLTIPELPQL